MKYFLVVCLVLCYTLSHAQYDYGLILENDAKIEGKLNLNSGVNSIFIGQNAGFNDDGSDNKNTFIGFLAGQNNIDGDRNVFVGSFAGRNNTSGHSNVFLGDLSGNENVTGFTNVFVGTESGRKNTTGIENVFLGQKAGQSNIEGNNNVFVGNDAGRLNDTGSFNTFLGSQTGYNTRKGEKNTFLGYRSGVNNTEGSRNVFIGYDVGSNELSSHKLYIDNSDTDRPLIWGDFHENDIAINGTITITETAKLRPMEQPSTCNTIEEVGVMYFDSEQDRVLVCTRGSGWRPMN